MRKLLFAGLSLTSAAAGAAVPSPMWLGVERVVIDCQFDPAVDTAMRATLCSQILAQAKRLTNYPVSLAKPSDLDPRAGALADTGRQLVLHVAAEISRTDTGPMLVTGVRAERLGGRSWSSEWSQPVPVRLTGDGGSATFGQALPGLLQILSPQKLGRGVPSMAPRSDRF